MRRPRASSLRTSATTSSAPWLTASRWPQTRLSRAGTGGLIGHVIQVALGVGVLIVDGGVDYAVPDRLQTGDALHGAGGAEGVADHGLGGADRYAVSLVAEGLVVGGGLGA